jgi:ribosome-binding protein aMBF1 (putative translation factor)
LNLDEQFRQIVEEQLQAKGWSRSELARQVGCGPQMVTDYLNGRSRPGPGVVERFFAAFGIEPVLTFKKSGKQSQTANACRKPTE